MITSQQLELLAPLSGVQVPLDQVPDPVFSNRLIGDGLCIDPTSQVLCAPLAGTISNLPRTGHAISITHANGVQVLLHIGLDTVNLGGQGFTALVEEGQEVAAGQALIEFDADYIALHARSLLTFMLVVSGEAFSSIMIRSAVVESAQTVIRLSVGTAKTVLEASTPHETLSSGLIALPNLNGLHARPAAVLAQAAKGFSATVCLHKHEKSINAKSLVAIMTLQTEHADEIRISANGDDAEQAIRTLSRLLAAGCGESITPVALKPDTGQAPGSASIDELRGVCASSGSAFGYVVQFSKLVLDVTETAADPGVELRHLQQALNDARTALQHLCDNASGKALGEIFKAHQELLEDPELLEQAHTLIAQGKTAGFAWRSATEAISALFKGLGNRLLAERALDIEDVGQRVLKQLLGIQDSTQVLPDQAILIAEQLTPSQTAALDTAKVVGFVTVAGGATSHVAILARALGLPAICGIPASVLTLANGTPLLLDADCGEVYLQPDVAQIEQFNHQRAQQRERQARDLQQAPLAACTRDGQCIEITANIASLGDAEQAMSLGAEGVGLLRSEFLYLERLSAPSQDEQVATYQAIARAVGAKHNLVARTLDIGGDKPLGYVPMDSEANPFLGMRGIRLCLQRPELLREQFRAMLSCVDLTRLHILLPMVTQLSELRMARQLLQEQAQQLGLKQLPKLGIMIEVPAAALMADLFAPEVDFFSIGTNDLTQYTLAMDRDHPRLASQADSFHPAVLRLIAGTVKAAHAHGKWVAVCGALASERLAVPMLIGLGVDELSVSVPLIPSIKARVRELDFNECRVLADQVLSFESAEHVRAALQPHLHPMTVLEN